MSRVKLLHALWDEETMTATIIKKTPYGIIQASARPHKEDMDIASYWTGMIIAERKCNMYIQHERVKKLKARYEAIKEMSDFLDNYKLDFLTEDEVIQDQENWTVLAEKELLNSAKRQYIDARDKYRSMRKNFKAEANMIIEGKRKFRKTADAYLASKK